jgi:hypothetical protein
MVPTAADSCHRGKDDERVFVPEKCSRRRRRRRMYYCGGPYKEQAGTVPTYTRPMYATVVYGPVAEEA